MVARALGAPVVSRASTWAAKAESLDGADIVRAHVVVGEVASVARPQTDDGRRCVRRRMCPLSTISEKWLPITSDRVSALSRWRTTRWKAEPSSAAGVAVFCGGDRADQRPVRGALLGVTASWHAMLGLPCPARPGRTLL